MGSIASLPKKRQKARIAQVIRKQSSLTIFCRRHQNFQNKKDHHQYMAMVLRFLSDSREISFRLDDCPPEKNRALLPIGVISLYYINWRASITGTGLSGIISIWMTGCPRLMRRCIRPVFLDVPYEYCSFTWIERGYDAGLTGGCTAFPLRYCPARPVTHAQMVVFLVKAFGLP
jgi:hypothetical protein